MDASSLLDKMSVAVRGGDLQCGGAWRCVAVIRSVAVQVVALEIWPAIVSGLIALMLLVDEYESANDRLVGRQAFGIARSLLARSLAAC